VRRLSLAALLLLGCGTKVLEPSPPPPPATLVTCPPGPGPIDDRCIRCARIDLPKTGPTTTCLACKIQPGSCPSCVWTGLPGVGLTCQLCPIDGSAPPDECDQVLDKLRVTF
jgi:hypothetical protein